MTTYLGSFFSLLFILSVKNFFLMSYLNSSWHSFQPSPCGLSPNTRKSSTSHSTHHLVIAKRRPLSLLSGLNKPASSATPHMSCSLVLSSSLLLFLGGSNHIKFKFVNWEFRVYVYFFFVNIFFLIQSLSEPISHNSSHLLRWVPYQILNHSPIFFFLISG